MDKFVKKVLNGETEVDSEKALNFIDGLSEEKLLELASVPKKKKRKKNKK